MDNRCGDCRNWWRGGIGAGRGGGYCLHYRVPKIANNRLAPKNGCFEPKGDYEK